uniref:Uncharacterized protein n=1 Tax=Ravinvirus N15 TaxID=40631 RepID=Q37963_9CAUD|nr:unknown [Escherichia phage N15]
MLAGSPGCQSLSGPVSVVPITGTRSGSDSVPYSIHCTGLRRHFASDSPISSDGITSPRSKFWTPGREIPTASATCFSVSFSSKRRAFSRSPRVFIPLIINDLFIAGYNFYKLYLALIFTY